MQDIALDRDEEDREGCNTAWPEDGSTCIEKAINGEVGDGSVGEYAVGELKGSYEEGEAEEVVKEVMVTSSWLMAFCFFLAGSGELARRRLSLLIVSS